MRDEYEKDGNDSEGWSDVQHQFYDAAVQAFEEMFGGGEVSITVPQPASAQSIVYHSADGNVVLLQTEEDGINVTEFTPEQARDLADSLVENAGYADGAQDKDEAFAADGPLEFIKSGLTD